MSCVLGIELRISRGAWTGARLRMFRPRLPWVARIDGPDPRYGLARVFLDGRRSYRHASRTGSRGIWQWYELHEGHIYEVFAPLTATKWDRYFCRVLNGQIKRIDKEDVASCLASET